MLRHKRGSDFSKMWKNEFLDLRWFHIKARLTKFFIIALLCHREAAQIVFVLVRQLLFYQGQISKVVQHEMVKTDMIYLLRQHRRQWSKTVSQFTNAGWARYTCAKVGAIFMCVQWEQYVGLYRICPLSVAMRNFLI